MSLVQIRTVIQPCDSSGGPSLNTEKNHTPLRGQRPITLTTSCKGRAAEEINRDDATENPSQMVCLFQGPARRESWMLPQPPSLQASVGDDGMLLSIPLCISRSDVLKISGSTENNGVPTSIEGRCQMNQIPSTTSKDCCSPNPKISSDTVQESIDHSIPLPNYRVLNEEASRCEAPLEPISRISSLSVLQSSPRFLTSMHRMNSSHGNSPHYGNGSSSGFPVLFYPAYRSLSSTAALGSLNPSTSRIRTSRNLSDYSYGTVLEKASVSKCHRRVIIAPSRQTLGSSNPGLFNLRISNTFPQVSSVHMGESVSTCSKSVGSSEGTFGNNSCAFYLPSSREHLGDCSNFVSSRLVDLQPPAYRPVRVRESNARMPPPY